jgi:ATP-binding cassette subfamily B protein
VADQNSAITHRVVSAGVFFQPGQLPAVVLALVSSLLLAVSVVSGGAIVYLATHGTASRLVDGTPQDPTNALAADRGFLPLADQLRHTRWHLISERLIDPIPVFHTSSRALITLMIVLCVALGMRWLCSWLAQGFVSGHVTAVVQRLRQHIHRKAIRLEPADLTGDQSRATDRLFRDSSLALEKAAVSWGQIWLTAFPDLLAVTGLALLVHWRVAVETLVPVVLCWFALRLESQRMEGSYRLLSEQADRSLRKLAEGLRKTRIVTGFAMEQMEQQQFEKNLATYRNRCRQMRKQQEIGRWIHRLILLCGIFVPGYLLAQHAVSAVSLPFASAVMIASCAVIAFGSLQRLQNAPAAAEEAGVRAEEISSYIARVPLVGQAIGAKFMEPMARTLLFDQVCLSTPQHPRLLNHLDLRINCGETVALLSLSPVPAYALASMIPRFVDPDAGQVLIDGQDIRQATLESLRAEVVFVGGGDPVFNGTIVENVTCGQSDITRQQVQEACKLVHADNFIRNLPRGYDTVVGEHGASLDAGQTFRLSLARAVARKPALLIIEEPQSPLDAETKAMLDDAYQRLSAGRTIIFLPSRLSTVKKCQRIVMIHEGRVAADDTHDRLVRSNELYRHWEYMRFNTFRDEVDLT